MYQQGRSHQEHGLGNLQHGTCLLGGCKAESGAVYEEVGEPPVYCRIVLDNYCTQTKMEGQFPITLGHNKDGNEVRTR